ncbi:MAG TPA: metallophosphoesterase [Steroidobacteraceae bacterium]|nr:metallophosphoesterase [Steroidobacteraceae bacterium]
MRRPAYWFRGTLLALCLGTAAAQPLAAPDDQPPRLSLPASAGGQVSFVIYGDTRFTREEAVANPVARRALVERIAAENPAAIFVGGDLVYRGNITDDYATYRSETLEWARRKIPVFPALGNHELSGCEADDAGPCLENWWQAFPELRLRPYRWYSVSIGQDILAIMLDSAASLRPQSAQHVWFERQIAAADTHYKFILVVLHYPPVRDAVFPRGRDEAEIERYLSGQAAVLHAKVIVVGSHVHNYERFSRNGIMYLVSGGGGAKPVPAFRMSGELSQLKTSVNFHYLRFRLENQRLDCTMVRFDAADQTGNAWSEPDRFEVSTH